MSISSEVKRRTAIKTFIANWKGRGREKQDSQTFWLDLLESLYGVPVSQKYVQFENTVDSGGATNFIDGYIPATKVIIEQKSFGRDLYKAYKQSDGEFKTPYQQAKSYDESLPASKRARWIIVSDFSTFLVFDQEKTDPERDEPIVIRLEELENQPQLLKFLVDEQTTEIIRETELSIEAGELIGELYDALKKEYPKPITKADEHDLNKLCVRLVFCYYADDADLFGEHLKFQRYIEEQNKLGPTQVRRGLQDLFRILNTPIDERDKNDDSLVNTFSYVDGGLFEGEPLNLPKFTNAIVNTLLKTGSHFDWSTISPTIFGAVFESTLNPETRRQGGMHYTSIENIRKVTKPLFLDALQAEFDDIKKTPSDTERNSKLKQYRKKLGTLKFLDPACGSGNFLTLTYTDLRKLDNEALKLLPPSEQGEKVSIDIDQFYGIEINDFAVSVAKTAMWIAESQMQKKTEDILHKDLQFFPLTSSANIFEADALKEKWEDLVPFEELSYIIGNPPFNGASKMAPDQKKELIAVVGPKKKLVNSLDYVAGWYYKAMRLIEGTKIQAALVSTNSISQGEQVTPLWEELMDKYGLTINFAYRTFIWNSESTEKAKVHCEIVGFSGKPKEGEERKKYIFSGNDIIEASNINPYLLDAPNAFIESRGKQIQGKPSLTKGNQASDGGNLIFSEAQYNDFVKKYPDKKHLLKRYIGGIDFINNNEVRYCLWLDGIDPSEYAKNRVIQERLEKTIEFRSKSTSEPTRNAANWPYRFFSRPQVMGDKYLAIPRTSSHNRQYVPMGFLKENEVASDSLSILHLPGNEEDDLYIFGLLTSSTHMAWLRTVGGRLKSDYRYSGNIVYSSFVWPNPTPEQKKKIAEAAKNILEVRSKYPKSSLAVLYDRTTMPVDLLKAHKANDREVMEAYGFNPALKESEIVANLFKLYQDQINELAKEKQDAKAKKAAAKKEGTSKIKAKKAASAVTAN